MLFRDYTTARDSPRISTGATVHRRPGCRISLSHSANTGDLLAEAGATASRSRECDGAASDLHDSRVLCADRPLVRWPPPRSLVAAPPRIHLQGSGPAGRVCAWMAGGTCNARRRRDRYDEPWAFLADTSGDLQGATTPATSPMRRSRAISTLNRIVTLSLVPGRCDFPFPKKDDRLSRRMERAPRQEERRRGGRERTRDYTTASRSDMRALPTITTDIRL